LGTVVVAIFGAAFAGASLLDYGTEKIYSPHNPRFAGRELSTWYRLEDVERGFALIEERVGENDLVVLDFQGAFTMRMHYRVSPPDKKRRPWARQRRRIRRFSRNGVTYFYAHVGIILTPATLLEAVERVLASKRLPDPERVWTVRGSWEFPLAGQLRQRLPEIPFDADVDRESKGLVFAIDMKNLRAIAARAKAAEARKRSRERSP
jgi:hypothetical protein